MKVVGGIVALALLGAACSVSTPRSEPAPGHVAATASGSDGVAGASREVVAVPGVTTEVGAESAATALSPATGPTATTAPPVTGPAAAVTAAETGPVPGVTEDTITLSVIAGFSGPLAPMVNKAYEAMLTWRDDVNEAGGIHGRQVVLKPVDHKETADGGIAACKEALSNGSYVAAVPEGIDANVTAVSCLDAAGMPTVYFAAAADPTWKVAFADLITSEAAGTLLASYVRNHLRAGDRKIGVVYVNQAAYKAVADTFVPEGERTGLSIVAVEAVEPNQGSFTSTLLRMQQKGVEVLVISATAEAIGIVRDARSMGWEPLFTGWGYLFDFVTQAARVLFDGVTGLRPYASVDSSMYEEYAARMAARGRARDNRAADLEGFVTYGRALLYGEMLRRAGPDPTRASFVTGAETIEGYDNGIMPPTTFGPGDHIGAEAAFPVICCNSDYTWKARGPARTVF